MTAPGIQKLRRSAGIGPDDGHFACQSFEGDGPNGFGIACHDEGVQRVVNREHIGSGVEKVSAVCNAEGLRTLEKCGTFVTVVVHGVVSHEQPMHVFRQVGQGLEGCSLSLFGVQSSHCAHQPSAFRQFKGLPEGASDLGGGKPSVIQRQRQHMAARLVDWGARQTLGFELLKPTNPSVHATVAQPMPRRFFGARDLHGLLHDQRGPQVARDPSSEGQIAPVSNPKNVTPLPRDPS